MIKKWMVKLEIRTIRLLTNWIMYFVRMIQIGYYSLIRQKNYYKILKKEIKIFRNGKFKGLITLEDLDIIYNELFYTREKSYKSDPMKGLIDYSINVKLFLFEAKLKADDDIEGNDVPDDDCDVLCGENGRFLLITLLVNNGIPKEIAERCVKVYTFWYNFKEFKYLFKYLFPRMHVFAVLNASLAGEYSAQIQSILNGNVFTIVDYGLRFRNSLSEVKKYYLDIYFNDIKNDLRLKYDKVNMVEIPKWTIPFV